MFTGSEGAEVLYSRVITWPGTGPAAAEAVIPAANPTAVKRCRFNVFIVFIFLRTEFRKNQSDTDTALGDRRNGRYSSMCKQLCQRLCLGTQLIQAIPTVLVDLSGLAGPVTGFCSKLLLLVRKRSVIIDRRSRTSRPFSLSPTALS